MPATYTHHVFTKDVYKALKFDIKQKFDPNMFDLFGKSFDALFFYKPRLGSYAHKNQVNSYFANIIYYLRKNNFIDHKELLSYLYGSICHYVLDSTVHPFIYYYGGKYDKNSKKTYKYRGKHDYIEVMIDAIICQERYHQSIYKCHIGRKVFPKIKFSKQLANTINQVYFDTFGVKNGAKIYFKSYYLFRFTYKHLFSSRFGFKKGIYAFLDWIPVWPFKLQNLCYYVPKLDYKVLNLEHKKWYYPVDKKISYHYSFYDLYDVAIVRAVKLITLIDEALDKDEKTIKKVIREIGNLSYTTGVNEKRKVIMKYFIN